MDKNKQNNLHCSSSRNKQSGFSLIEVLIAAVILSIGILGVVGLQVMSLKGTQQSYMKQQAMSVVQNLTERMRSNREGVLLGHYVLADSDAFDCATTALAACSTATANCSAQNIAKTDLHNLICGYKADDASRTGGLRNLSAENNNIFIDGGLSVDCVDSGNCNTGNLRIEMSWTERELHKDEEASDVQDSLVINTRIGQ